MTPAVTTHEIMQLFEQYGNENYDGGPLSQTAHMIQCGMLAEKESGDPELIVGAFLHDIGHLLQHAGISRSIGVAGAINYKTIGAQYLQQRRFSDRVCAMVEGHVAGKRYLAATNEKFRSKLSPVSWQSLQWQGGPMSQSEISAFWQDPFFQDIVAVRLWDEAAKEKAIGMLPLHFFETKILEHLTFQQTVYAASRSTRSF